MKAEEPVPKNLERSAVLSLTGMQIQSLEEVRTPLSVHRSLELPLFPGAITRNYRYY